MELSDWDWRCSCELKLKAICKIMDGKRHSRENVSNNSRILRISFQTMVYRALTWKARADMFIFVEGRNREELKRLLEAEISNKADVTISVVKWVNLRQLGKRHFENLRERGSATRKLYVGVNT